MPRPVHFDMTAEDPQRAVSFYSNVFGWTFQKWEGPMEYWMISTGSSGEPGIDGGLGPRRDPSETGTTNVVSVSSVDDYVAKITSNGGSVTAPKSAIPGVGYLAYCTDTEGNLFGLMEFDESAA